MVERFKKPLAFASLLSTAILLQPYETLETMCRTMIPGINNTNVDSFLMTVGTGARYFVLGATILKLSGNQNLSDWVACLNPFGLLSAGVLLSCKEQFATNVVVALACVFWLVCAAFFH